MNPDEPATPREPEPLDPAADREEHPLVAWAKAIVLGIGDTARDMLEAGRQAAREAMDEGWRRFDEKTRRR
ncbi:hypothetical protein [Tepidiforma sp.]|uniref:hypothetical protein n=1 Tax=Tepidiforma sp. TaxID=2682230 RepID=UPI002ADE210D|nr:hypothetical protein [Tepidiforma sp.]